MKAHSMHGRLVLATLLTGIAAGLAPGTAAPSSVSRPMSGSCDAAPLVVPSPDPGALFRVVFTATCRLTHLGKTDVTGVEDVYATPTGLVLIGQASYRAANGDLLLARFSGPVQPTGPTSVAFSGTQTFVGGTGRFADASGTTQFEGTAENPVAGAPGVGAYTISGSIVY